jgi:endonuclease/exonuclease/phosphatase family metal-dependent hydrolase
MTYNIRHGEGLDGRVDLERIAAVIRNERADIVALQEVDKGVERTNRLDLPEELARLTGMTCIFSNNHAYQGGEYGNALLTRFPVVRWTNHHYRMLRPGEQRGLLQAVLDVRGRRLVVLNTHLDFRADDSERWSSVQEIEETVRQYRDLPVILAGDFNDVPDSRVWRRLAETFDDAWSLAGDGDGFTIPADNPQRRIDYIRLSKYGGLVARRAWVPDTDASDHRPVVVELVIH